VSIHKKTERPGIKWQVNHLPKSDIFGSIGFLNMDAVEHAQRFHSSFPEYRRTPLAALPAFVKRIGIGGMYVKDESYRFGLNAFKVLGGSYAIGRFIAETIGIREGELTYQSITSPEVRAKLGSFAFFTATDGNHGRGVAWAAKTLRQKAVVYMPAGSSSARLRAILNEGADASITDLNYDDAVRLAASRCSETPNSVVVQDTAWEGYTDIPTWIMQGYGTMALEAQSQLEELGAAPPTHVFVQAGVGSMAASVQGFFATAYKENPPAVIVVESNMADCFYKSAVAGDGKPRVVGGDMQTLMAGLACGEPNILAFEALRNHCAAFVSCPDWVAVKGMRILGNPMPGDTRVLSGESGAVTIGLVYEIMTNDDCRALRQALGLGPSSRVLCFSTEGDTDPDKYLEVVWDGVDDSVWLRSGE